MSSQGVPVHTVFSYNGYIFDLGTKNANLLVAYIGSSPQVPEVEQFIKQVYGPNIGITVDPKAVAHKDTLDSQATKQEGVLNFVPKQKPAPLVFPELPQLIPTLKGDVDNKLEEILKRVSEKGFEYNEEYKQGLITRAENLLYKLYQNLQIPRNAAKVLQQELDTYRHITREYGATSRRRIRQQLVIEQLITRYSTQYEALLNQ